MINAVQVLFINDTRVLGAEEIEDDFRSGQPAVVACSIKNWVKDMVIMDRRTTVRIIADELGVSCYTVHGILTEEL